MAVVSVFLAILGRPTVVDMMYELMVFTVPLWVAVLVGVLVGWVWKPKWANLSADLLDSTLKKKGEALSNSLVFPSLGTAPQFPVSLPSLSSLKIHLPDRVSWSSASGIVNENCMLLSISNSDSSLSELKEEKSSRVNEDDLKHLYNLVNEKDGGPTWIHMMDKSTAKMSYQAWRRDPETGPPQYRSRTIYENASPETLRDFFWDDEFRSKWDDMLVHAKTLEDCSTTGTMMVHWVRKFPFFCSDREYIIGRRIWVSAESGRTFYCVTKGVPCPSVPRRNKPRRVDLYYSSWCIREAKSKIDGQLTACEVILFHHEDMGIPWEIAKIGIRHGMWGAVKMIYPGLVAYQKHRTGVHQLSNSAVMAQINTKFCSDSLENWTNISSSSSSSSSGSEIEAPVKPCRKGLSKTLVIGGAIILACTLDRGLLTKALIFGVARRFGNRRL